MSSNTGIFVFWKEKPSLISLILNTNSEKTRFEFSPNIFTEYTESGDKIFVKKIIQPLTSYVRDKDDTIMPARCRQQRMSLNLPQFMFQ